MSGIQKIAAYVLYVLAGLTAIFAVLYFFGGDDASFMNEAGIEITPKKFDDLALIWAYHLVVIIALITLGFTVYAIASNTKALEGFLMFFLAPGVLLFVASYIFADPKLKFEWYTKEEVYFPWVSVGINLTLILFGVAVVMAIASEIYRAVK